jgi:uncharacterized paraquat-inducible protein A
MPSGSIAIFVIMVLIGLIFLFAAYRFLKAGKSRAAWTIAIITITTLIAAAWLWRLGLKAISTSFFR